MKSPAWGHGAHFNRRHGWGGGEGAETRIVSLDTVAANCTLVCGVPVTVCERQHSLTKGFRTSAMPPFGHAAQYF
jgi:hypothetical protein